MLGNIKSIISTVQDGITSNSNLRQTLQEVQKVKYIFKEKSRSPHEAKVNYCVGSKILDKYQEEWAEMHQNADANASAAAEVDTIITEVTNAANSRLVHAKDLAQSLTNLPKLSAAVDDCVDNLKEVQNLVKIVEEELANLEDLVERSHLARRKIEHHNTFNSYGIPKRGASSGPQLTLDQIQIEDDNTDLYSFLNS